jgi:CheY-like chemotaxis protein/HPt (histidine-containing phosphotransfer) domain-containing protein
MHNATQTLEYLRQELAATRLRLEQGTLSCQQAEGLLAVHQQVLTAVAAEMPLADILDILCQSVEAQSSQGCCTILLRVRNRLRLRAAANLPASYTQAMDGLLIGPGAGACGAAAYRGTPIIVQDIAHDPLWTDDRDIALQHGLRACFSNPILSTHGHIMGTFAFYYREARGPTAYEQRLSEDAVRLAAIAVKSSRLAKAFRRAKASAATTSRARGTLLASVSHDIHTPMLRMRDVAGRLLETPLNPQQHLQIKTIEQTAATLLEVSNDLLDFAELETGALPLVSLAFSLRQSFGTLLKTFAPQAHAKGLELICHVDPEVPDMLIGDIDRLSQVVHHMVRHAITATAQGEVVIEVLQHRAHPLADRMPGTPGSPGELADEPSVPLHITIRDTRFRALGIIPTAEKPLSSPVVAPQEEGSALGLAISQQLVALMGGWCWVESVAGHGYTFHCTIRCGLPSAPPAPSESGILAQLRHLSVLVVVHHPELQQVLQEMLTHWGIQPTIVAEGDTAVGTLESARAAGKPFALVLLDAVLPDADGWAFAGQLRQHPDLAATPIVMLSPGGQPEVMARSQDAGIAVCLTKPVMAPELWDAVLTALGPPAHGRDILPMAHEATDTALPVPRRILLAEDNLVNQLFARRLLEKRGHTVVTVSTGRQVLDALAHDTFDVVLMDLQMPEMGGLDTAMAIRQREHETGRHIPIIAMTAYAMQGDRERCLAAGMDDYIAKPIHMQTLLDAIAHTATMPVAPPVSAPSATHADMIFDRAVALMRTEGDLELLQELVVLFLDDCPKVLANLRQAMLASDAPTLERLAHTLKGAVENFAAHPTAAAAQRLEILGRQGNMQEAKSAYASLETEITRLMKALRTLQPA